jgi:predicted HAD superfamily Cof-like phosphohydrolase
MRKEQEQVKKFMLKAGQECPAKPTVPNEQTQNLRLTLHEEEAVTELREAFAGRKSGDPWFYLTCAIFPDMRLADIADSLADSLVVILGTAVACGIDIDPIFQEVMKSNMTKFIDGYRREDGKWMKGPSYTPTNIQPLIDEQMKTN